MIEDFSELSREAPPPLPPQREPSTPTKLVEPRFTRDMKDQSEPDAATLATEPEFPSEPEFLAPMEDVEFPTITIPEGNLLVSTQRSVELTLTNPLELKIFYKGVCTVAINGDCVMSQPRIERAPNEAAVNVRELEIDMSAPEQTYILIIGTKGTLTISEPHSQLD